MVEDRAEARTVRKLAARDAGGLDCGFSSKGGAKWSNSESVLKIKSVGFADELEQLLPQFLDPCYCLIYCAR